MLKRIIDFLFKPSLYQLVKKNPSKYSIDNSVILLAGTTFNFYVPNHTLNPAICIAQDTVVGCNFIFESTEGVIKIGKRTYIGGGTNIIARNNINIGDDVFIAWRCYIYDHNSHSLNWRDRVQDLEQLRKDYQTTKNSVLNKNWDTVITKPITIKDKVWIGFEAVILKGVTIGEGAIIGARSVVTHDVPPYTIVAGNPARVIRELKDDER